MSLHSFKFLMKKDSWVEEKDQEGRLLKALLVGLITLISRKDSSSLIHYLPRLDKDTFCAIHSQFSDDDPEFPLFCTQGSFKVHGLLSLVCK